MQGLILTMNTQPVIVTEEMRRQIAGAVAEIDLAQMAIVRKLTPAQRVQQAASMIEAAERVGAHRLRQRNPELSEREALRMIRRGIIRHQPEETRWWKQK